MTTTTSRRAFLKQTMTWGSALAAGSLTLAGRSTPASGASGAKKPNFLIIVADDMGYSDAGCYGGDVETPHLDRLAANGLRFSQCYSTGRCWPSRTALLTGYYPQQVRQDPPRGPLPRWARVVPHYLKPQGYRCYTSGKWHLRGAPKAIADGNFDRSYVLHDHDRFFAPKNHEQDDKKLPPVSPDAGAYVTTDIAKHAVSCLEEHAEKHADQPFYSYLAFTCPHFPLHALQKDIDRYRKRYRKGWDVVRQERWKRLRKLGLVDCDLAPLEPDVTASWSFSEAKLQEAIGPGESGHAIPWNDLTNAQKDYQATKMAIHAAMIDRMDREIGRVLKQIKKMNALDDTVIFFVSDNGASGEQIIRGDMHDRSAPLGSGGSYLCLGPGWSTAANTPFRLHKSWVHEGGVSSPLIIHWPKGLAAQGELRHNPCHFIDVLPTVLDLAGADDFSAQWNGETAPPLPGKSLAPVFARDNTVDHDFIYYHHMSHRAIRVGDWKLVAKGKGGPWELYNIKRDRSESRNQAERQPQRVKRMAALWQRYEDLFKKQAGPPPQKRKR